MSEAGNSPESVAAVDPYASRVGGTQRIVPRIDPVLHHAQGSAAAGPLDAAQLEAFDRDGYLFLAEVISAAEVNRLLEVLDRHVAQEQGCEHPEIIREPDSDVVRSVFRVHETIAPFAALAVHPAIAGAAQQILGSEVYIHQSRVNLKPGFEGKEFYWHSDFETWHVEDGMPRMRALSCAVNLAPNLAVNGPLMVIPGSHRHYVACAGRTPERHYLQSLRRQEYGVPDREAITQLAAAGGIVAPTGPSGSAVMFDCNIMHGSNGNITPFPRKNAFFVYNSVHNRLGIPFGGTAPRPDYIASREVASLAA